MNNDQNADECKRAAGEREAFEAKCREIGYTLIRNGDAGYLLGYGHELWSGFQAGAAWQRAQPVPVVPEGYVLVPKSIWIDAASIEALAFVMGGPEEDDGSPTYCDCVMWVGEIDDDGVKRHGIHVYNTECEEEGSTTLAEFTAAPAQGQQVECQECERWRERYECNTAIMHARTEALDRCREAVNSTAAERDQLRAELSALKAQQVGQEPVYLYRRKGLDSWATCDEERYEELAAHSLFDVKVCYDAPQPAPAKDVADDLRFLADYVWRSCCNLPMPNYLAIGRYPLDVAKAALAAHDKQSGGAEYDPLNDRTFHP